MNWKRTAKSFERDIQGALNSKDKTASDVGVLAVNVKDVDALDIISRNLQENESSCPEDKVITCDKGIATSIGGNPAPPGTSCKDACDGQCCVDGVIRFTPNYYGPDCFTGIYEYCGCLEYPCLSVGCKDDKDSFPPQSLPFLRKKCVKPICDGFPATYFGCSEVEYDDATGNPIRCLNLGYYDDKDSFPPLAIPLLQIFCIKPACEGLTASICQDSVTCSGADACTDATVGTIHLGCNGSGACFKAGKDGYLGSISNGCEGRNACLKTGYGGNVTMIQNSCKALAQSVLTGSACANAASNGGKINSIIDSCVSSKDEDASCFYAASNGGYIGDIINSCNQVAACDRIASDGGYVLGLNDSCNACNICDNVGLSSNPVNFIMDTCCSDPPLGPEGCGGCSGLGGSDLPDECQNVSILFVIIYQFGSVVEINTPFILLLFTGTSIFHTLPFTSKYSFCWNKQNHGSKSYHSSAIS